MFKPLTTIVRAYRTTVFKTDKRLQLHVENVSWTVNDKELSQYFSKFGKVVDATVAFDPKTNMSRGFAYVTFMKKEDYDSALNTYDHELEGRPMRVEPAN